MKEEQKKKDQRELVYLELQHATLLRDISVMEDRMREVKNRLQVKLLVDFPSAFDDDTPVMDLINQATSEIKRLTKVISKL